MQKVIACIKKVDDQFQMFADNDNIAIAMSFGIDSMVVANALIRYSRYRQIKLNLTLIHIDIGFNDDYQLFLDYFAQLGIKVIIVKTMIKAILEQHLTNDHFCCGRCSRLKKGALINKMKEEKITKVVYGHHFDDLAETFLMNLIHNGKAATFAPVTYLTKEKITLLRPLVLLSKNDIIKAQNKENIPYLKSCCPRDQDSERVKTRMLIEQIYKKYPQAVGNFKTALMKKW